MLSCVILWSWGFRFDRVNGMLVMHRQPSTAQKSRTYYKILQHYWLKLETTIELGIMSKFGAAFAHFLVQCHNNYLTYKLDTFADFLKPQKLQKSNNFQLLSNDSTPLISIKTQNKPENRTQVNLDPKKNHVKFNRDQKLPKQKNQKQQEQTPILFLHGLGAGTLPYLGFLLKIMREFPDHPLILTEMRHVAMRWTLRAKSINEVATDVATLFSKYGIDRAHVIGHSYGTFVASTLVNRYSHLVESICLIDPVCMMICEPTLVANFIYKGFGYGASILDYVRFFYARDLSVAEGLCRNAYWTAIQLWPEDFPEETRIL
eukprot:TRINITY_DN38048_c0_g1_i2.p1 TRINITY_DN38048_c0_g1~~TRINITY_DN38048_c0_g1_i2.p1  ORF type:complete len:336 (+),score=22.50 TRINITY_DN38048_c0_g1_i2:55-1008(+)